MDDHPADNCAISRTASLLFTNFTLNLSINSHLVTCDGTYLIQIDLFRFLTLFKIGSEHFWLMNTLGKKENSNLTEHNFTELERTELLMSSVSGSFQYLCFDDEQQ